MKKFKGYSAYFITLIFYFVYVKLNIIIVVLNNKKIFVITLISTNTQL